MKTMGKAFKVALLGCGTVGSGVARIMLDQKDSLESRAGRRVELTRIVDLFPSRSASRHDLPLNLFAGGGADLSSAEASAQIDAVFADPEIDLVVETIGGTSAFVLGVCERAIRSGKHLVTANKALLAEKGELLFSAAQECGVELGFEAAVCGAIPVIRVVKDSFAGDEVASLSGIMNGTSNYVLSKMQAEELSFQEALSLAQSAGYAEADPTLDIGGGDAGHKLALLIRLAFGRRVEYEKLAIRGIQDVSKGDIRAAKELDCAIKLICQAQLEGGVLHAQVSPMMVKETNVLSRVNGATNAIRFMNRYSGEHILVGKGAGSLETGSAVVADIVFIARNEGNAPATSPNGHGELRNLDDVPFPYTIIFDTEDVPGITGLVTTAIGDEGINIDTVGHNLHGKDVAVFCVETMPCPRSSVDRAIAEMRRKRPGVFRTDPKVYPVLG